MFLNYTVKVRILFEYTKAETQNKTEFNYSNA